MMRKPAILQRFCRPQVQREHIKALSLCSPSFNMEWTPLAPRHQSKQTNKGRRPVTGMPECNHHLGLAKIVGSAWHCVELCTEPSASHGKYKLKVEDSRPWKMITIGWHLYVHIISLGLIASLQGLVRSCPANCGVDKRRESKSKFPTLGNAPFFHVHNGVFHCNTSLLNKYVIWSCWHKIGISQFAPNKESCWICKEILFVLPATGSTRSGCVWNSFWSSLITRTDPWRLM